ncbi:MAG: hypothetical protein AAB922_07430 [Patescibacteria group bacterium]
MNHSFQNHEPKTPGEIIFILFFALLLVSGVAMADYLLSTKVVGALVIGMLIGFWMNE